MKLMGLKSGVVGVAPCSASSAVEPGESQMGNVGLGQRCHPPSGATKNAAFWRRCRYLPAAPRGNALHTGA